MNPTHIHLLLNHFPIIGSLIGGILFIFGSLQRNTQLSRAGAIILFIMALLAIPVYLTGEPAEESVEKLPGVSEVLIEAHEEAAGIALALILVSGLLAMMYYVASLRENAWTKKLSWVVSLIAMLSFAAMARTGYLGGQIRHTEIRSGSVPPSAEGGGVEKSGEREKDDD